MVQNPRFKRCVLCQCDTEAHVMWADLGLGLANHGCQISVFNFQVSTAALLPTVPK